MKWNLGLNFFSNNVLLFNPSDLEKEVSLKEIIEKEKFHIYIICKRKKIFFNESSLLNDNFYLTRFYSLDKNHNKLELTVKHPKELKINYLRDSFFNIDFRDKSNLTIRDFILINTLFDLKTDPIGTSCKNSIPTDLEVMYIGQAFGRTGSRKIDYRLSNHEKLQKITLKVLDEGTNEEVLIIGIEIGVSDIETSIIMDPKNFKKPNKEDIHKLRNSARLRVPEAQELTIFEASLISYFQPSYNKEYKETFPSSGFKSIEDIYNTNFDYTAMSIDTKVIGARLYSKNFTQRMYVHYKHFPLTTRSERLTLFEYLMEINDLG